MADGGAAIYSLLCQIDETVKVAAGTAPGLCGPLGRACRRLSDASAGLLSRPVGARAVVATDYAEAFALVLGGWYHLRSAMADPGRQPLAAFFMDRLLPFAGAHLQVVENAAEPGQR